MEGVSPLLETFPARERNEFEKLTSLAVKTQECFGKVSGNTGWSSVSSVMGHVASSTNISGSQLASAIQRCYGSAIAEKIDQQLRLTKAGTTPISVYKVAKAVAMVKELTFLHDVEMEVDGDKRSLDPNDPFYLTKKANFKTASKTTDKNKLLREQEWPVITTTMGLDPAKPNQKTTTIITPAGKSAALRKEYAANGVNGIPSSDTSSNHAVGLRINKSDQFSIVSSGLDVPLKTKDAGAQQIIQTRFEERLLVNLETQGKLPARTPTSGTPGSSVENPITISMTDFGLLSADISKEGKAQDKQFEFLKGYDGTKEIAVTYSNADGNNVTIYVKPTVKAFNFGAQWMDRSIIGRTVTYLKSFLGFKKGYDRATAWKQQNEAVFDQLIGLARSSDDEVMPLTSPNSTDDTNKALAVIIKFTGSSSEEATEVERDLIKTIFRNYTGSDLNLDNLTETQQEELEKITDHIKKLLPEVQQARERLKSPNHPDYHDEALVLVFSSLIGAAPNIHCKSGKDRTSLLLSYSQWLMHEIKHHEAILQPGIYTAEQRARLDKFLVGTGNGYWQFLNTMNVGNKQAAGWFSFRSNFYKTLTPSLQLVLAGNEADSTT